MKIKPLLLVLLLAAASDARGAIYEWTDADGVVHFTDNHGSIPAGYRKKARKVENTEEPAVAFPASGMPQPVPQTVGPSQSSTGGHDEGWWRRSFSSLRFEAKALQDGLPAKQAKLAELRRKHAIYEHGSDRAAANALEAEIAADQTRIAELQKKLDELDLEASRAAVPLEWRK